MKEIKIVLIYFWFNIDDIKNIFKYLFVEIENKYGIIYQYSKNVFRVSYLLLEGSSSPIPPYIYFLMLV